MHGTLELPKAKAPFPLVLLVAGSGPTDRDGNQRQFKNDSLKLLAENLADRGIASLRFDKRGIGESKVDTKEADLRFGTYVDDVVAWGAQLRKDSRFCAVAIVGHSEGALIGTLAAQRFSADGVISIAGAGRKAGQLILQQMKERAVPTELMQQVEDIVKALEAGHTVETVPPALAPLFRPSVQPYLISSFKYDPAQEIGRIKSPVLILQGSTDIQVSVDDAKLLAGANRSAKFLVIDGMNHILKDVPADLQKQFGSYADPSLPIDGRLLDEMAGWIVKLPSKCPSPPAPPAFSPKLVGGMAPQAERIHSTIAADTKARFFSAP